MPDRKIVAVVGATGSQGGGLVRRFSTTSAPNSRFAPSRATPIPTRPARYGQWAPKSCSATSTTRRAS
jgi:hypothetical protein